MMCKIWQSCPFFYNWNFANINNYDNLFTEILSIHGCSLQCIEYLESYCFSNTYSDTLHKFYENGYCINDFDLILWAIIRQLTQNELMSIFRTRMSRYIFPSTCISTDTLPKAIWLFDWKFIINVYWSSIPEFTPVLFIFIEWKKTVVFWHWGKKIPLIKG